jgi:hypothetical protein
VQSLLAEHVLQRPWHNGQLGHAHAGVKLAMIGCSSPPPLTDRRGIYLLRTPDGGGVVRYQADKLIGGTLGSRRRASPAPPAQRGALLSELSEPGQGAAAGDDDVTDNVTLPRI